ncbi:hypothetical protein SAMN04489752_2548 [Brevibacterium siliguriense]|uniref:Uncharacterized protein n=1 Tax=Brevibacterium siliguriense TaxID=1136497 RepID=A0A1H1V576_9MICO|nr:hypothetical protein [Brevibacterium siliguriense]SDS79964.1 hypothetical protein SAMN04489752_2548 [Brevibacterium siliguriense]
MLIVGGRDDPIAAAAVPDGAVAAMLCFAAVPLLLDSAQLGTARFVETVITFPCWFWGPALALAVWGYVGHRRGLAEAGASVGGADDPVPA